MKQIDLGGMSFAELRENDLYYVDKTGLIKDILDSNRFGVYLFTRPRRFGKTVNLSMLDAFFNIEYKGNKWFDGLEISRYPEYEAYKNAFPVIRLNLNSTKKDTYASYINKMREAVRDAYRPHRYLLERPDLDAIVRRNFEALDRMDIDEDSLSSSIKSLSGAIAETVGTKPIILIDEYDAAATNSYGMEVQEEILKFLRDLLESSLKTNENRQMAYMTGVMQIAKQSIFSGLNNVTVNNIFSKRADEKFGFTESEVETILKDYGHPEKISEAREWYDGYRFGDAEVYNPYSIMNYVYERFEPGPYWIDSGSDAVIKQLLMSLNDDTYADVLGLVAGSSIVTELTGELAYGELKTSGEALYSLMAISGYLKAVPLGEGKFDISIPDREVGSAVDKMIRKSYPISDSAFNDFNRAVLEQNADKMTEVLQKIMFSSSYMNLAESTYQAVIMTIMHGLSRTYDVKTESEEGNGRVDIILRSRSNDRPNMIFEIKKADTEERLGTEIDEALAQIHKRRYYLGMPGKVILVGLAFFGKIPKGRIETIDNGTDGTGMLQSHI